MSKCIGICTIFWKIGYKSKTTMFRLKNLPKFISTLRVAVTKTISLRNNFFFEKLYSVISA